MKRKETEMTAEEVERIPGTMYWGCDLKLHMMCIEADQRPSKRPWSSVVEYIQANPDEAAKMAVVRQGSLKLTPLGIACQEAPSDVVKVILDIAPEAITIGDKYKSIPIHRAALNNRLSHAEEVMRMLRDANPSSLIQRDGWKRTPLMCALESGRGVPSPDVVEILLGDGESATMENKKGKTALDLITERKDKVSEEARQAIIDKLVACSTQ